MHHRLLQVQSVDHRFHAMGITGRPSPERQLSTLLRQPADLGGTVARRPLRAILFLATPSDPFRIERLGGVYPMHKNEGRVCDADSRRPNSRLANRYARPAVSWN